MDYKKYYEEVLDVMLNSNDVHVEFVAKRIKKNVLRIAVEEEFSLGLRKVQEASLISSEEVVKQSKCWFGYDNENDNIDGDISYCYNFIRANDYDSNHVKFIKENWKDINEIFIIIRTKLDTWYLEAYTTEHKNSHEGEINESNED